MNQCILYTKSVKSDTPGSVILSKMSYFLYITHNVQRIIKNRKFLNFLKKFRFLIQHLMLQHHTQHITHCGDVTLHQQFLYKLLKMWDI